jgi:hypothetical protein
MLREGLSHVVAFRLPFDFDPARLAEDASRLQDLVRLPQPGPYHNGEWTGVAIRSAGGVQTPAPGFPSLADYRFTAEADHAPYLKDILDSLPFFLQIVRVLWLPPGGVIESHFDFDTNFQFGMVRLHIPIQTNPEVEFLIAGRRFDMRVGELWYGDFSQPHQVVNHGGEARLHAVLDVEVGDELLALMPADYVAAQARLGPISKSRPEWRSSDDPSLFECGFFVPGKVLPLLVMGRLVELFRGAPAQVRCCDGDLILCLGGKPHCRLVRVGEEEFAIQGMPPGCFLRLRRAGGAVASATLVVRGVQEDLVAARVGVQRGERIGERQIDLDLIVPG